MKVYVNEELKEVAEGATLLGLKKIFKDNSDVMVYNGFVVKEDMEIKDNDRIVFIKRGQIPNKKEIENQLMARHTPGIHEKIKKISVGIAGLGGLGSNVAVSLARTGIGKLLLVDFDLVEPSNLNRQYYFINQIGISKTEALRETIKACNPFVDVKIKDIFLDKNNIKAVFKDVDIIVEAFDNKKSKAIIVNTVLSEMKEKIIVSASGMAGYYSSNTIVTKKINDRFYLVGDMENESKPGCGLMAPRVAIAANHQANMVLRIILEEFEV